MAELRNWFIENTTDDPFKAPEAQKIVLTGNVYGHPKQPDGKLVSTSPLIGRLGDKVVTQSRTEYDLGEPLSDYEAQYPNAKSELLGSLERLEVNQELHGKADEPEGTTLG